MKKLLMMAAAAAVILPMGAQAADTASGSVTLTATTPNTCAIREFSVDGVATNNFADTNGGADAGTLAVTFGQTTGDSPVDLTTARAVARTRTVTLDGFCNYADHKIQLQSAFNGMTRNGQQNEPTASGDFNRRIQYNALIRFWGSANPDDRFAELAADGPVATNATSQKTGTSSNIGKAVNTSGTQKAVLYINTLDTSSAPLLAGTYTDTLRLRLGNNFQ